jgi:hypothetical protein
MLGTQKKPGSKPGEVKVRQTSKPSRGNGRYDSAGRKKAVPGLKSAPSDIGGIAPLSNAACLMKGLRWEHGLAMYLKEPALLQN